MIKQRIAQLKRETKETQVEIEVNLDGTGLAEISTGVGMLDHMLTLLSRHSRIDITVKASGDLNVDAHHTVEDVGIALGLTIGQALGSRAGIVRMGHAIVPMDESLALVALDLGGRGYASIDVAYDSSMIGELPTDLIRHFLESFAYEGRMNIHARLLTGLNDHHKAEAVFKALARALDFAIRIDDRLAGQVPSTKGVIQT